MRGLVAAVIVAVGIGFAAATPAAAAPAIGGAAVAQSAERTSGVLTVRQGCGRGWHRNWRGRCVPNRPWRRCWRVCR